MEGADPRVLALFTNPDKLLHSDVRLEFGDGTAVYTHKYILASAFDFFKELFSVPETDVVDMRVCPEFVTAERLCLLLSWLYDERLLPDVVELRDLCRGKWFALEQIIDYAKPLLAWQELFDPSCKCCQHRGIAKDHRLCKRCWERAGDVHGRSQLSGGSAERPPGPAGRLNARRLTYDLVWQEGRMPTPDALVRALCRALRASQAKTCAVFKQLVGEHIPDRGHRLTEEQAQQLQEVLAAGNWCTLTELGVHNMMALTGEYQCRRPGTHAIHCYGGFQEDKTSSLKESLAHSSGVVLDRSSAPAGWQRNLCDCQP